MTDVQDPAELKQRLWREIDHVKTVMLGLVGGPPRHFQPMTAFCQDGDPSIWFYTRKDTDLVGELGAGHTAMFTLMTGNHGVIACVGGELTQDHDRERIAKFWNPVVAAWYPEGKDDPALTLLRMDPTDAEVWVSHANPIRFGFEVAKANLTRTLPDMGGKEHLTL